MDIFYKHRWGVYQDGVRIRTYYDEEVAISRARSFQRDNTLSVYVVKQISWLYED